MPHLTGSEVTVWTHTQTRQMALRINNVGIVVEDLELAIEFRYELLEDIIGLEERRWMVKA